MSDPKEESATAINSLSSSLVSATATGFSEIAKESSGITYTIINHFHFAPSPEAVPERAYADLHARLGALETHLAAIPDTKTHAFKCKEEFDQCWAAATTKPQKSHCLMTYSFCMGHGFNLSFPLPGS